MSILKQIGNMVFHITEEINKLETPKVLNNIAEKINISEIQNFLKSIDEMPKTTKFIHKNFLKNGWYLDSNIELEKLKKICKGNFKDIDVIMSDYINNNLEKIKNNIITLFPHRSDVLNSVFNLHEKEAYNICIPMFLIQADGICNDMFCVSLYAKNKKGEPLTKSSKSKYLPINTQADELEYIESFFPLDIVTALNINVNKIENPKIINRHKIIHGEDLNYGDFVNSCKVISSLNYLANIQKKYNS